MVKTKFNKNLKIWSKIRKNIAAIEASAKTITAPIVVSFLVGHVIRKVSCLTSWINFKGFFITLSKFGRSGGTRTHNLRFWRPALYQLNYAPKRYLIILVTTPAPTVFPPSLIAKFKFSFIAIGVINLTVNFPSSPGITISVPDGKVTSPVTSVVLK